MDRLSPEARALAERIAAVSRPRPFVARYLGPALVLAVLALGFGLAIAWAVGY